MKEAFCPHCRKTKTFIAQEDSCDTLIWVCLCCQHYYHNLITIEKEKTK